MLDGHPPGGKINAVPFQAQHLAAAETIQGGDLHKGIDRVVTDRVKQSFELVGVVIAGLIALLLRKLNELTRIRLKDTIFYGFIQRLVDDVLVLPQGGRGQAAFAVFAPAAGFFIEKVLEGLPGDILQTDSALVKIGDYLGIGHQLIALKGHRVHPALRHFQP